MRGSPRGSGAARCALVALVTAASCDPRVIAPREPTWNDVEPVLVARCASCHGTERHEGSYRVETFLEAISCPTSTPDIRAVQPAGEAAAILTVLTRDDHRDLLEEAERALLRAWVEAGAPGPEGSAHGPGWGDPRSGDSHARALREEGWARLFDGARDDACTRCHAGATREAEEPSRATAPGATACTSCHTDEGGPFACSTCHGAPPPRGPCGHAEEEPRSGAHVAHVEAGLTCETCHEARDLDGLASPASSGHGDGSLDVVLDPARAGEGASLDESDGSCTTACHARGGSVPAPRWQLDRDLDCGSCHASPPSAHYPGECTLCHAEASADGTSLVVPAEGIRLHANGRVDLGDGTGGCGACHGSGEDPMPASGAHAAHASPRDSLAVGCAECHRVPEQVEDPGHLDEVLGAEVVLGARAAARGAVPVREGPGCREIACHGAGLGGGRAVTPSWYATDGAASRCGSCHGLPPPAPHPDDDGCSATICHGGYTTIGPGVSALGREVHGDGAIDLWSAR